jgi:hypothetical protein
MGIVIVAPNLEMSGLTKFIELVDMVFGLPTYIPELGDFMLPASAKFETVPYEICGETVLLLETDGLTVKWNKEKDRRAL